MEEQKFTPSQYFDFIKNAKNTITTESLKNSYDTFKQVSQVPVEPAQDVSHKSERQGRGPVRFKINN